MQRIQRIPIDKLKELNDYVAKLEQSINKKEKILSFAGTWEHIDENIFDQLTENLIANRERNKSRIDE